MADEISGFGFWEKLNEQELMHMISHPEAFSSYMRCFAAQELSNKLMRQLDGSSSQDDHNDHPNSRN